MDFEVHEHTPVQSDRGGDGWWARASVIEGERTQTFSVVIPDRNQAAPTFDWIEGSFRALADDSWRSAIDQLAERLVPREGCAHSVIHLSVTEYTG